MHNIPTAFDSRPLYPCSSLLSLPQHLCLSYCTHIHHYPVLLQHVSVPLFPCYIRYYPSVCVWVIVFIWVLCSITLASVWTSAQWWSFPALPQHHLGPFQPCRSCPVFAVQMWTLALIEYCLMVTGWDNCPCCPDVYVTMLCSTPASMTLMLVAVNFTTSRDKQYRWLPAFDF